MGVGGRHLPLLSLRVESPYGYKRNDVSWAALSWCRGDLGHSSPSVRVRIRRRSCDFLAVGRRDRVGLLELEVLGVTAHAHSWLIVTAR